MKNLILNPEDPTTNFLSQIYSLLQNKTVVKGGITKSEFWELIESLNRVIMLEHGSPYGLLSRGQFPDAGLFVVDGSMTSSLKNKSNCIFIWCFADQFLKRYGLSGLCSGMFISEVGEAAFFGFEDLNIEVIKQSNDRYAEIVAKYLKEPINSSFLWIRKVQVRALTEQRKHPAPAGFFVMRSCGLMVLQSIH